MTNTLYFGDNLDVLRRYVKDESVDLIYLDPPFNSKQDYNVLFREQSGEQSSAQIKAFGDTWHWDSSAAAAFHEMITEGPARVADVMRAFEIVLGRNDMLAYLSMMAPRLVELHRVLKSTGSIYLHCDPTASHYLKLLMDAIFGVVNFRNEIIWKRTTAHSSAKKFAPIHDTLLYYSKGGDPVWNSARTDYEEEYLNKYYRFDDGDGRLYWRDNLCAAGTRNGRSGMPWHGIDPTTKGMHWKFTIDKLDELDAEGRIYWPKRGTMPQYKRYREELKGKAVPDIWDDVNRINPVGNERLGYPTQKPEELLERIINASSNEGDVILDSFCGCGTAIAVAQRLNRQWIGIDITHLAVSLMKHRLFDAFGDQVKYKVIGEPTTFEGAVALALEDRYNFEFWALGLVGARANDKKKGADKGIDGRLYFSDDTKGGTKQIIFSVKSGKLKPTDVREMPGIVTREKAEIGVLITLEEPTGPMRSEAASHGFYESPGWNTQHPRVQIITVRELLDGKRINTPPIKHVSTTFKKAPKARHDDGATQLHAFDAGNSITP